MAMLTRRQVCHSTICGLGLIAPMHAASSMLTHVAIDRLLFDSRLPDSCAFAAEGRRLGLSTYDARGDVAAFCTASLIRRCREGMVSIAGMTPFAQLFALRMMVESPRMRLLFLDLTTRSGATYGPVSQRSRLMQLHASRPMPVAAAQLFSSWPSVDASAAPERSNIASVDDRPIPSDALVTWLLAPVDRSQSILRFA